MERLAGDGGGARKGCPVRQEVVEIGAYAREPHAPADPHRADLVGHCSRSRACSGLRALAACALRAGLRLCSSSATARFGPSWRPSSAAPERRVVVHRATWRPRRSNGLSGRARSGWRPTTRRSHLLVSRRSRQDQELLAAGVPVVVTAVPWSAEWVAEAGAGRIVRIRRGRNRGRDCRLSSTTAQRDAACRLARPGRLVVHFRRGVRSGRRADGMRTSRRPSEGRNATTHSKPSLFAERPYRKPRSGSTSALSPRGNRRQAERSRHPSRLRNCSENCCDPSDGCVPWRSPNHRWPRKKRLGTNTTQRPSAASTRSSSRAPSRGDGKCSRLPTHVTELEGAVRPGEVLCVANPNVCGVAKPRPRDRSGDLPRCRCPETSRLRAAARPSIAPWPQATSKNRSPDAGFQEIEQPVEHPVFPLVGYVRGSI